MLKFIPLLVTAVLALPGPLLAQDAGRCCGSSRRKIRL